MFLKKKGVDTGIHWRPNQMYTMLKNEKRDNPQVTNMIAKEILSLPFHSKMKNNDINFICKCVVQFFKKN